MGLKYLSPQAINEKAMLMDSVQEAPMRKENVVENNESLTYGA